MPKGSNRKKKNISKDSSYRSSTQRLQKKIAEIKIKEQDEKIRKLIQQVIMKKHCLATAKENIVQIEEHFSNLLDRFSDSLDIIFESIFSFIDDINQKLNYNSDFYSKTQFGTIDETEFTNCLGELCRHELIMAFIRPCIKKTRFLDVDSFSINNTNKMIMLCQSIFAEAHFIVRELYAGFRFNIMSYLSNQQSHLQPLEFIISATIVKYSRLIFYTHTLSTILMMSQRYNQNHGDVAFILQHHDAYHSYSTIYKFMSLFSVLPETNLHGDNKKYDLKSAQQYAVTLQKKCYKQMEQLFSKLCSMVQKERDFKQLIELKSSHEFIVQANTTEKNKTLSERIKLYCPNLYLLFSFEDKKPESARATDMKKLSFDNIVASSIGRPEPIKLASDLTSFPKEINQLNSEQIKCYIKSFKKLLSQTLRFSTEMGPTVCTVLETNIKLAETHLEKRDAEKKQRLKEKRKKLKKAKRARKAMASLIASEEIRISKLAECKVQMVTHHSLAAYQPKLTDAKNLELPWSIAIVQAADKKTVGRQLKILQIYRYRFSHQFMQEKYYQIWKFLSDAHLNNCILEVTQTALTLMLISLSKFKFKHKLQDGDMQTIKTLFRRVDEISSKTVELNVYDSSEMSMTLKLAQARRLIIDAEIELKHFSIKNKKEIDPLLKKAELAINSASLIAESQSKIYHDEATETLRDIKAIRYKLINRDIDSKTERQTVSTDVKIIKKTNYKNGDNIQPAIPQKQLKAARYSTQFNQIWIYQRAIRTHGHSAIWQHAKKIQQQFQFLQNVLRKSKLPHKKLHHMQSFCSKLNTLLSNYSSVLGKSISTSVASQTKTSTVSINQILQSLRQYLIKGYLTAERELVNEILPCLICDGSMLTQKQSKLINNFKEILNDISNKHGLTVNDITFYITGSTLDKFHPNFKPQTESDESLADLDLTICLLSTVAQNKLDQVVTDFKTYLPNQVSHAFVRSKVWNMYQCHNVSIDGIDIDLTIKCAIKGQEHSNTFEHELALNITEQTLSLTNKAVSYQEVFSKASNSQFDISEKTASKFEPYTVAFVIKKSIQYISKYGLSPGPQTRQYFGTIFTNNLLLSQTIKLLLHKYVHKNGNIKVYHALLQYPLPIIFDNMEYNVSLSYIVSLWLPLSQPVITRAYHSATITSSDMKKPPTDSPAHRSFDIKQDSLRYTRR